MNSVVNGLSVTGTVSAVVAALGLVGIAITTAQKSYADRRDQWWKRMQWALDELWESEERRSVALAAIEDLCFSAAATDEDRRLAEAVALTVLTDKVEKLNGRKA